MIHDNKTSLIDIQSQIDYRKIPIQKVGIRDFKYPIRVSTETHQAVSVPGIFDLSVDLNPHQKGSHLSRFVEILQIQHWIFSPETLAECLLILKNRLNANCGYGRLRFPFFLEKKSPITNISHYLDYQIEFRAQIADKQTRCFTHVEVPVTSLCPCSKAISQYGAHNQRCLLKLQIETQFPVPFEHWIRFLEQQGSCEVFALLKRPDEKFVTERAYENPKFVEDIVRDIAFSLNQNTQVLSYQIEANSIESIHNHEAYALVQKEC